MASAFWPVSPWSHKATTRSGEHGSSPEPDAGGPRHKADSAITEMATAVVAARVAAASATEAPRRTQIQKGAQSQKQHQKTGQAPSGRTRTDAQAATRKRARSACSDLLSFSLTPRYMNGLQLTVNHVQKGIHAFEHEGRDSRR